MMAKDLEPGQVFFYGERGGTVLVRSNEGADNESWVVAYRPVGEAALRKWFVPATQIVVPAEIREGVSGPVRSSLR